MKRRIPKLGPSQVLGGLVGVVSAVVGLLTLRGNIRITVIIVSLTFLCTYYGYELVVSRRIRPIGDTDTKLHTFSFKHSEDDDVTDYSIRLVDSESDLLKASRFDASFFPDDAFDFRKLNKMWARFPTSIFICENSLSGEVLGVLGVWPITENTFTELHSGQINELEIQPSNISKSKTSRYWWISVVAIDRSTRRNSPFVTPRLLHTALEEWIKMLQNVSHVNIVASGWTDDGRKLLKKLGFAELENTDPRVFWIEGQPTKIFERMMTIFKRIYEG